MPPCFEKQGCDSLGARGGEPARSSRSPSKCSERRLCPKAREVKAGGETHQEDGRKPRGRREAAGVRGPGEAARAPRCFCYVGFCPTCPKEGRGSHAVGLASGRVPGTHARSHVSGTWRSTKPVLQAAGSKQMAPQHSHFTTLQLLLGSRSKHFPVYHMREGGQGGLAKLYISSFLCLLDVFLGEGRAFLVLIYILQDSDFALGPSGLQLLFASLQIVIALWFLVGNREMEGCYADIKGLQSHAGKHESKRDF